MNFSFRPARRSEAKPLIGLYAESGAGKTYSSLLLARGFAGKAPIGMIETEAGRGEAYADMIEGGYQVLPIRGEFSPINYGKAIDAAEQAQLQALIIDSASHEWEGAGGVLSMAADNQAKGIKGVLVWQQPKILHARHFMLRLLSTPIPLVIVCMRARYPMVQTKVDGKMEWTRSQQLEPKQADDILFEMFCHGWIDQQHNFHGTKYTRPELRGVIKDGEPVSLTTGERLAQWAKADVAAEAAHSPATAGPDAVSLPEAKGPALSDRSRLEELNEGLARAAMLGSARLEEQWKAIAPADQKLLKAALDRRHKPAAYAIDRGETPP